MKFFSGFDFRTLKLLALFAGSAAVAHVILSSLFSFIAASFSSIRPVDYTTMVYRHNLDQQRIFERLMKMHYGPNFVYGAFLRRRDWISKNIFQLAHLTENYNPDKKNVVILGSSMSWGYPYSKEYSLAYYLESINSELNTINLSIVGSDYRHELQLLYLALGRNMCAKCTYIVEVPLTNTLSQLAAFNEYNAKVLKSYSDVFPQSPSYLSYFLAHPWGVKSIFRFQDRFEGKRPRASIYSENIPVPGLYSSAAYANSQEQFNSFLTASFSSIEHLIGIHDARVIFYFSPIYMPAFSDQQIPTGGMAYLISDFLDSCSRHSRIKCLKPFADLNKSPSYFSNVNHLNGRGASRLAHELSGLIQ